MGKPYRRGSGWAARYARAPDPLTGARRQGYVSGRTRKEVEEKLVAARRAVHTGLDLDPTALSVRQYLAHWLDADVRHTRRRSSYERYERAVRLHLAPHLGHLALARLGPAHLSAAYAALLDAGLSARGVAYGHAVLHAALKQAVRWRLLAANPADAARPPRWEARPAPIWERAVVPRFLAALDAAPLGLLFRLATVTGMRRGELLALRWANVDLEHGTVAVVEALVKVSAGARLEGTKGKRARVIELTAAHVARLRAHRAAQAAARLRAGPEWRDEDRVFAGPTGAPPSFGQVAHAWAGVLAATGLPRMRLHDLRHLHATLLIEAGVPIPVVARRLGHASPAITMNVYAHVTSAMDRDAAEAFDAALARVAGDP